MAQLKIRKVTALPVTLEASTLYLLYNGSDLSIHVSDSAGVVTHTLSGVSAGDILTALAGLIGQPNGIAGLDGNGNVAAIEAQDLSLTAGGTLPWKTIMDPVIFKVGRSSAYGYARTFKNSYKAIGLRNGRTCTIFNSFTMPNDYAEGTDVILKMHISPEDDNKTGDSNWRLRTIVAESHIDAEYVDLPDMDCIIPINANDRYKRLRKDLMTLDGTNFKIGTDIKTALSRIGGASADTYNDYVFVLDIELYYQCSRIATKNPIPNYFT